jgi:CO dehydrogenase/acetyl-CoA synthase alpha subunit
VKNVKNAINKCGDCAKFQKYYKIITKSGWSNIACTNDVDIPKYLPKSQLANERIRTLQVCYMCSKIIVPSHIPLTQWIKYLTIYYKNNETQITNRKM